MEHVIGSGAAELEVTALSMMWTCRLNADGSTFDAVCTIVRVDDSTIEVVGALSRLHGGISKVTRLARKYFRSLGYTHYVYTHKGRRIKRSL